MVGKSERSAFRKAKCGASQTRDREPGTERRVRE